jgi:hypothetical protein
MPSANVLAGWRIFHNWLIAGVRVTQSYVTTDGQSVTLGVKRPSGAYDQIFITVRQLQVC